MGDNFLGIDGVNAVRCEIGERDAIYVTGLDLGEGESFGCTRYIDVESGEFVDVAFKKFLDTRIAYWDLMVSLCNQVKGNKRRKTTYKTVRKNCAKRNRHK